MNQTTSPPKKKFFKTGAMPQSLGKVNFLKCIFLQSSKSSKFKKVITLLKNLTQVKLTHKYIALVSICFHQHDIAVSVFYW